MKKVLSLVLVLTLVLGSFSMAFAKAPSDVVGTEYEDAVERLGQLGIFTGYTDGTFKPANTITRSEFAAVVVRAKGLENAALAAKGVTAFADVPADNWAAGYVNIASKMGFVKGYPNGNFGLNDPITYEQAVTLVVRALGYDPAAEARGGYPYGYLIVANENGLLDSVKGTQGLPAPRGLVAQLVDNALETPLMIQTGYGAQTKWVVSGTEDTKEVFLLDDLGFDSVEGRVTKIDSSRNYIIVTDEKDNSRTLDVKEGFNFEEVNGLKIKAWHEKNKDNDLALYTVLDTPLFDATTLSKGDIKLISENKTYEVAKNAVLTLDGETVRVKDLEEKDAKFDADYAKVVLDKHGDIIWLQAFTFDNTIVVEEVKDDIIESFDYDELKIKGYTIVKEGKGLKAEELEKGDIVFFNKDEKVAIVHNNSESGAIEKVYNDSFKFAGDTYDIIDIAKYLDKKDNLGDLTKDALAQMVDSKEDVTVYFDFAGEVVLVAGAREVEVEAVSAFLVTKDTVSYTSRGTQAYWTLDVLNAEGKVVNYDITQANVEKYMKKHLGNDSASTVTLENAWKALIKKDNIVKVTLDEDGKVTNVSGYTKVDNNGAVYTDKFAVTAKYVKGYKLLASTLVFRVDGAYEDDDITTIPKDYEVTTMDKAEEEFGNILEYALYVTDKGDVAGIYAVVTDANDDTTTYTGLVTDIRYLRGDKKADVTIEIEGEEKVYTTTKALADKLTEKAIERVKVGNKSGEIEKVLENSVVSKMVTVDKVSISDKAIKDTNGKEYRLTDKAKLYNEKRTAQVYLRDLEKGDEVTLFFNIGSEVNEKFVQYVVLGQAGSSGSGAMELTTTTASATVTEAVYNTEYVLKVTNIDTEDVVYSTGTADVNGDVNFTFTPALAGNAVYKFELFKNSPVTSNLVKTWEDQFLK